MPHSVRHHARLSLPKSNVDEFTLNRSATASSVATALFAIVKVIVSRDHDNKQETPMRIRSTLLAIAAIATIATVSLTPASAAARGHHSWVRITPYSSSFLNRNVPPGVLPCKRGIIWVCQ
jgi:hypothetical protein